MSEIEEEGERVAEAFGRYRVGAELGTRPRLSLLDQMAKVVAATREIRTPMGNLSARLIAELYGVSLSELGKWLGRSRQALNKTPDANALQDQLSFFERI